MMRPRVGIEIRDDEGQVRTSYAILTSGKPIAARATTESDAGVATETAAAGRIPSLTRLH